MDQLVLDGGQDDDEKEWDYPEEEEANEDEEEAEEEEREQDEGEWDEMGRHTGGRGRGAAAGGQLSDDDMDVDVYAQVGRADLLYDMCRPPNLRCSPPQCRCCLQSMYGDREKYQYSAYMSDSDASDIEADPEYQEHMRNLYGAGEDGTPCMCPLACPQHAPLVGPWQPRR